SHASRYSSQRHAQSNNVSSWRRRRIVAWPVISSSGDCSRLVVMLRLYLNTFVGARLRKAVTDWCLIGVRQRCKYIPVQQLVVITTIVVPINVYAVMSTIVVITINMADWRESGV